MKVQPITRHWPPSSAIGNVLTALIIGLALYLAGYNQGLAQAETNDHRDLQRIKAKYPFIEGNPGGLR